MFIKSDKKGLYKVVNDSAKNVVDNIQAGTYQLKISRSMFGIGITIEKIDRYDNSKMLNVGVYDRAFKYIKRFVSPEMYKARESMKMMHKLALIFDGPIGTGKTYLAGQIGSYLAKTKNALTIISHGEPDINLAELVDSLRVDQPDRLIVLIMDEYEKNNSGETDMLSFLDGSSSRNNVIVIATTNSTNSISNTIKKRKGRIEKIFDFGSDQGSIYANLVDEITPTEYRGKIQTDALKRRVINSYTNKTGVKKTGISIDEMSIEVRDLIHDYIVANKNIKNNDKNKEK